MRLERLSTLIGNALNINQCFCPSRALARRHRMWRRSRSKTRFEDPRRREAAHKAILYAFDLIEHDGEDLRDLPFLNRKAALARLLRDIKAGTVLNEHVVGDGPTVFEHACRLGAEGIVSKKVDGTYRSGPCPTWVKVRNPASVAVQRERSERWNR